MNRVQTDFNGRVAEIEAYLTFVKKIDAGDTLLMQRDSIIPAYTSNDQIDLIRTFKASAFLLLYNLMESTVSNAIEAIFDEFSNNGTSFDSCRRTIRRLVLDNLRQHNLDDILPELNCLSIDVMTKSFRKNKIVSGNVDAREIKNVADKYGFAHPSADGTHLLTVKTSRNDLAHGSKSFAEVGRDYSVEDIIGMKDKIIAYLNAMLVNVTTYINQQLYLATPDRP
jgi:hypothetical protein